MARTFEMMATRQFNDIETGEVKKPGDIVVTSSIDRIFKMLDLRVAKLHAIHPSLKKKGKKVVVYQNLLYCIGGIETADSQLARAFKDRNITFIFKTADFAQAARIGRYCDVMIDDGKQLPDCDVLILANYDSYPQIKGRIKAKKIYQQVHADWAAMKQLPQWRDFRWTPDPDVKKVLAVSETVQESLKRAFDKPIESVVVPNILLPPTKNKTLMLVSATRLTSEKGADRIKKMADMLEASGLPYFWLISAALSNSDLATKLQGNPHVIIRKPAIENVGLLDVADYCVQLSDNESFCYTVREALSRGTRCICTRIPEFEKLIKSEKQGYLVNLDLSDFDPKKIYSTAKRKPALLTPPKPDPIWEKVLDGKL